MPDPRSARKLLYHLDKGLTFDEVRALSDIEVCKLEALLDHWHGIAKGERDRRREPPPEAA